MKPIYLFNGVTSDADQPGYKGFEQDHSFTIAQPINTAGRPRHSTVCAHAVGGSNEAAHGGAAGSGQWHTTACVCFNSVCDANK